MLIVGGELMAGAGVAFACTYDFFFLVVAGTIGVISPSAATKYDGAKKIEATDDTFKEAGKVGLSTKADSVTYFDDLKVVAK